MPRLNSETRAASESTVAVEGLGFLALSGPVDTGENIPSVDAEPGASALDRTLSVPRGVARCKGAAVESDGRLLANIRNSARLASSSFESSVAML